MISKPIPLSLKYLQTLLVVAPMTFIIGMFSVIYNGYFRQEDWFVNFLENWLTVLPVAYLAALLIIPLASKLTNFIYSRLGRS